MKIDASILNLLCSQLHFQIENEDVILFAVRGSLPSTVLKGDFMTAATLNGVHLIQQKKLNYKYCRCTIGIWLPKLQQLALFPGSTVPSIHYIQKNPSSKTIYNQLCPGMYSLKKGIHPRNPMGMQKHDAFLMNDVALVSRPKIANENFDFSEVKYEAMLAGDNLHAARIEPGIEADELTSRLSCLKKLYSSSGCMVVLGQPSAYLQFNHKNKYWNSWENFMELLSELTPNQNEFKFLLFEYQDVSIKMKINNLNKIRFGSSGKAVVQVQEILDNVIDIKTTLPYFKGTIDGIFDHKTAQSYLNFQADFSLSNPSFEININEFLSKTKHFSLHQKNKKYAFN